MGIYRHRAVPRAQSRYRAPNAVSNAEISLANVSYLCLATISFRPKPWNLSYTYNYNQSVGKASSFPSPPPPPRGQCWQGRIQDFLMGAGVADTNRPPNFTLIYLKLSYVCPKTWRCRKDELETVTLQSLETPQNRRNRNFVEKWRRRHSSRVQRHKFLTNHASTIGNCFCIHGDDGQIWESFGDHYNAKPSEDSPPPCFP